MSQKNLPFWTFDVQFSLGPTVHDKVKLCYGAPRPPPPSIIHIYYIKEIIFTNTIFKFRKLEAWYLKLLTEFLFMSWNSYNWGLQIASPLILRIKLKIIYINDKRISFEIMFHKSHPRCGFISVMNYSPRLGWNCLFWPSSLFALFY